MVDPGPLWVDPGGMQRWGMLILMLGACGDDGAVIAGGDAPTGGSDAGSGSGSGGPDAAIPGGVGEPAELTGMTLFHNQVRAAVDTPTPLPPLEWDPALAAYAAQWAAQCIDVVTPIGLIDHNQARQNVAGYAYIGENIYGSGGTATAQATVMSWSAEKANYNYTANTCAGVCGHYTQIVWRATTHVGCALKNCPGLQYGSTIVCDYGPGGNNGQRPY
jgi:pathogenesis-related protein 1